MASSTNFGITLKKGDGADPEVFATIAQVINVDIPGVSNPAVEATGHSDSYRSYVAGGLVEVEAFDVEIAYDPAHADHDAGTGLLADVVAGTQSNFQIVFPDSGSTTWTFGAIPTKFKPQGADAQSPDVLRATVTFRPSGTPTLA
jgi:hypothetical protein